MKMEQIGRNKTKYTSPQTSTWSTKQTTDVRIPPDTYWKYTQRNNQDTTDKNTRRHQNLMSEPTVSYYSSANSYKINTYPRSMHLKYPSAVTEAPQRYQQNTMKSDRNKDYANSVAVVDKDRYKNRQEDESNVEYIDEELGNFTEDNIEDEVEEEAENDQERVGESLDKEYDEQEADDEIDEESDAPAEPHVMQRNAVKKDALLRTQQRMQINQQQNPHKIRYAQYSPKLYQAHPLPTRYYRNIPDRDIHEALSEEDLYTTQALKNPPRKSSADYHQNWIPQRNSNRYDTMISPMQSSRRGQTRPEIKSFTEAEIVDRRKCSRCGNVSIKKPSISKKNNCRFQDSPNFSTRRHFGDDAEILNKSWCGYCKPKYHDVENMGPCEIPSPALYSMKTRRLRDSSVPMYETLEGKHPMDELSHKFARISSRYTKETPNILRDRTRHSAQTAQGATRMSVHYA